MTPPALVSIDLGAESCRVCLLRFVSGAPRIAMVHRFSNAPWTQDHNGGGAGLRWNLDRICDELHTGLRACAEIAAEGIASIGVTGWGVDYVRLNSAGRPLAPPFCYRDARNAAALEAVHAIVPAAQLYAITGVQVQPINTVYQLFADKLSGAPPARWVMLPEYILHWLGAPRIAEYTNATHTALIDPDTRSWSIDLFSALGLDLSSAPRLVPTGTGLGPLDANLRSLPAFAHTQLIAPACHDTASAVAGIPLDFGRSAYISSGTWSLAGVVLPECNRTPEACAANFTNLGAAAEGVLFHCGFAGMWILRQCLEAWAAEKPWDLAALIAAAQRLPAPAALLDLDDPAFVPPGDMPARICAQRTRLDLPPLPTGSAAAPRYASLILHSLAARYASVMHRIADLTGQRPERICVVGGGSRNEYLNNLTTAATGLPVERGAVESSTLGNFAVQLARLDHPSAPLTSAAIAERARDLARSVQAP